VLIDSDCIESCQGTPISSTNKTMIDFFVVADEAKPELKYFYDTWLNKGNNKITDLRTINSHLIHATLKGSI
jgi:hypothetical protein